MIAWRSRFPIFLFPSASSRRSGSFRRSEDGQQMEVMPLFQDNFAGVLPHQGLTAWRHEEQGRSDVEMASFGFPFECPDETAG